MPKLSAASSVSPMARGGLTAFAFAAREGDIPTAQVMLDAGVDINQLDVDKASPLITSLMNKQYTFAKFLLDRGANPNIVDVMGRTALYAVIDMRNEDYSATPGRPAMDPMPSIEIVKALLDRGANPNLALTQRLPGRSGMDGGDTTLGEGTTPLMRAARGGDAEVMRLLLAKGADPKKLTKEGNTALMFAAGVGYRDKNTTGTEAQALEALKVAMSLGIDVNQGNLRGETALHGAAGRGADTIVQYLASQGAKLDVRTRTGSTPLDVAMGKGSFGLPVPHDSTVELLRKLGAKEGKDLPPDPNAPKAIVRP
jgi:ankyrin repeat protein